MKDLAEREEFLKGNIITFIGESGDSIVNESGETLLTYKLTSGRKTFDSKAFEKDHPNLYQKYIRTSEPQRRFLLK
jgi:hypothetical protein